MGNCIFLRKGEVHTAPIGGILASDLAVGSTVKLMENGTAAEYLVVHQGLPSSMYDESCNGTWLLRKDIYEKREWNYHSENNIYKASTIHSYLNSTFLNLFDANIKAQIKTVRIPHVNGTGNSDSLATGSSGLSTKIFLLSGYEVGFTQSVNPYFPTDGAKLYYFVSGNDSTAKAKRIANLNSSATVWWLRSPSTSNTVHVWYVNTGGSYDTNNCTFSQGIRPALILPSTALFDKNTLILKGG